MTAVATHRICQLAQPKKKAVLESLGPTPKAHSTPYKASAHIEMLAGDSAQPPGESSVYFDTDCVFFCVCVRVLSAAPKHEHPKYRRERPVLWSASGAARRYEASGRLLELSSPREKRALFEGFDPYAVSRAALTACPSPRVRQLSAPLPRKCSSK